MKKFLSALLAVLMALSLAGCNNASQQESTGYGAVCGEESYYGQFDGKTIENYKDVDIVGSPTHKITDNGYLQAIERCFKAVEILEGGAK